MSNQYSFNKEEGKWQRYTKVRNGSMDEIEPYYSWEDCPITNVPVSVLVDEWQKLIYELSIKEEELMKVKVEYAEKEFQIKYVEGIDFKKLYGKANDDTRNHHIKLVCKDLLDKKHDLELSVDFLKREISLLKQVVKLKQVLFPPLSFPTPKVYFNGSEDDLNKEVRASAEKAFKIDGEMRG